MKRLIPFLLLLIFVGSSFSILFVVTNFITLNRELNDYIEDYPYAHQIIVGHWGSFNKIVPKYERYVNKINKLLYESSGEVYEEFEESSLGITEMKLEDFEIEKIIKLPNIKSYFIFDWSLSDAYIKIPNKEKVERIVLFSLPPDYLKAFHPPLKEGRYYDENDPLNVIIIPDYYSKLFFHNESPIGKNITMKIDDKEINFEVIGVLSETSKEYINSSLLGSGCLTPYPPQQKYYYRDHEKIPYISTKDLLIIPEDGKTNNVLQGIKNVLGKEKYDSIVSYSLWILENGSEFQIRKERITTLAFASFFTLLVTIFSIISFIRFDILSRRREIGIKRAIGATIIKISNSYFIYIFKLFFTGYLLSILFFYLFIPFFKKYNRFGFFLSYSSRKIMDILPLNLDFNSIIISFCLILVIIYIFTIFFTFQTLKQPPATLIRPIEQGRIKSYTPFLMVITLFCVLMLFTSSSIIVSQRKLTEDIFNDIEPDVIRILPKSPYGIGEDLDLLMKDLITSYTFDDYKAVKETFKEKAVIGFRLRVPYLTKIPHPQDIDKEFELRITGATEDFPSIFDLTLSEGRFIKDEESGKCVVGFEVSKVFNLKSNDEFMGFEVVGVLEKKAKLTDHSMFISLIDWPFLFPTPLSGSEGGHGFIFVKPIDKNNGQIYEEILDFLERRHPGKLRGVVLDIGDLVSKIANARMSTYILLFMFSLFAFISSLLYLSVLMLIDIIRRTKEIGIKRAIGATKKNIMIEFVFKSLKIGVLSLILGIILGTFISLLIANREGLSFYVPSTYLILFIIIYIGCITLFSLIPAQYAVNIKPNEAIRNE